MNTKLRKLLDSIDPRFVSDQIESRANEALNSFGKKSGIVDDWEDFTRLLARFFSHVEKKILRINMSRDINFEMDWGRCIRVLHSAFGFNGEKAAFEIARTGVEGGLYMVLKTIAKVMATGYAHNETSARVNQFWESLSVDEKLKFPDEYVAEYGHLLPDELTEKGAFRVKANFPKVLEHHPNVLNRLRGVG